MSSTAKFICKDCNYPVTALGRHDGVPVCMTCRHIRANPDMPEEFKEDLRWPKPQQS